MHDAGASTDNVSRCVTANDLILFWTSTCLACTSLSLWRQYCGDSKMKGDNLEREYPVTSVPLYIFSCVQEETIFPCTTGYHHMIYNILYIYVLLA